MPHDVHESRIDRWRGDDEQRRLYPYVKDDEDVAAFNAYASRGFLPPERPDGFLEGEAEVWAQLRAKTAAGARGQG